jgi:hypothetical protein
MVMNERIRAIEEELRRARADLAEWEEKDRRRGTVVIAGVEVQDPRIRWNLDFHRRRVAALGRARDEALRQRLPLVNS